MDIRIVASEAVPRLWRLRRDRLQISKQLLSEHMDCKTRIVLHKKAKMAEKAGFTQRNSVNEHFEAIFNAVRECKVSFAYSSSFIRNYRLTKLLQLGACRT